jgi:ABC-type antimicrobial peptide transport system permease subunit
MFFFHYITNELRRRRGRTILTALGLAVGVGLVIMVNALSTGLDNAQSSVLKPLTGVGTEMSVSRPLQIGSNGGFTKLSKSEQKELRNEVGGGPGVNFTSLKAGSKVDTDTFRASGDLTFPESELTALSKIKDVQALAPSLTLTDTHLQGTIPKINITQKAEHFTTTTPSSAHSKRGGFPGAAGAGSTRTFNAFGRASAAFGGGSLTTSSRSITGVDKSQPTLAAVTPSQITKGSYFSSNGGAYQAIVSTGYADSTKLAIGSSLKIDNKTFKVIGISSAPLGGTASDVYVELTTLQKLAGYEGQVDTVEVEAANAADVSAVSKAISKDFSGASVTTASDLA